MLITESAVSNGHTSSWICRRKLPWWVASDHVEETPSVLHLSFSKTIEIEFSNILTDWNGPKMLNVRLFFEFVELLIMLLRGYPFSFKIVFELLICLRIFLFKELLFELSYMSIDFLKQNSYRVFIFGQVVNKNIVVVFSLLLSRLFLIIFSFSFDLLLFSSFFLRGLPIGQKIILIGFVVLHLIQRYLVERIFFEIIIVSI